MFDMTIIIEAVIAIIGILISLRLIPYIKAKYSNERVKSVEYFIQVAVAAAEQLFTKEQGKEKKKYVLKFLENMNLTMDEDLIEKMIESFVLKLHAELYGAKQ